MKKVSFYLYDRDPSPYYTPTFVIKRFEFELITFYRIDREHKSLDNWICKRKILEEIYISHVISLPSPCVNG